MNGKVHGPYTDPYETKSVFGNTDQFDPIGQTAEKRVRKLIGAWAEFGLIAPVAFGNVSVRSIILIRLRAPIVLTNLLIAQIYVNKRSKRHSIGLVKICIQLYFYERLLYESFELLYKVFHT